MTTSLKKFIALLLIVLVQFIFISPQKAFAATSPSLGAAGSFSVLGGQTVTNTGPSTIAGDLGISPGSAVTAFPPGIVTLPYTIHTTDESAALAQLANTAAYLALSAEDNAACTNSYPSGQDLTGLSLGPGIYCSAGSFLLTGNLNLTGSGVWIFKTVSSLVTSPGSSVTGGDPCNVWWRIGSDATLDTTTSFMGNILAYNSIWLKTNATLNGRALAQIGEVTLDSNTITGASCLTAPIAATTPTPTPAPTPPICVGEEHLNASGTICVNWSPSEAPQTGETATTTTTTSTGQVLGASTLASTGSFNSIAGLALMIVGSVMTLGSLYAFKKRAI